MNANSIMQSLREHGLCVKEGWITDQLRKRRTVSTESEREAIIQDIFRRAMFSDFYSISTGCLPANLDNLNDVYLKGPFVVQIDEMFNIACTTDKRCTDGTGRMLKIMLTDGHQNVICLEHQSLPALSMCSTYAGIKVSLVNVYVRRGVLLLTSQNTKVLGGSVAALDKAKHSLLNISETPSTSATVINGTSAAVATRSRTDISSVVSQQSMHLTNPPRQQQQQQQQSPQQPHPRPVKSNQLPLFNPASKSHQLPPVAPSTSANQQEFIDFNEEEAFFNEASRRRTQLSAKSEEEEMEERYCDEFEIMDDFIPPEGNCGGSTQAKDMGMTKHPSPHKDSNDRTNCPKQNGRAAIQSRSGTGSQSIESLFHGEDVINLQHLKGRGVGVEVKEGAALGPPASVSPPPSGVVVFDISSSPASISTSQSSLPHSQSSASTVIKNSNPDHIAPGTSIMNENSNHSQFHCQTTYEGRVEGVSSRAHRPPTPLCSGANSEVLAPVGVVTASATSATNVYKSPRADVPCSKAGILHRIFFDHIAACGTEEAAEVCRNGYIEGNALSIKKFSVIEKKVKVPYFLTKLEFNDGKTSRDVQISSRLCESFLQISVHHYIEKRNNFILTQKLGKKEGGNEFKRQIALQFGQFSGRYKVSFVNGEFCLEEVLSDVLS